MFTIEANSLLASIVHEYGNFKILYGCWYAWYGCHPMSYVVLVWRPAICGFVHFSSFVTWVKPHTNWQMPLYIFACVVLIALIYLQFSTRMKMDEMNEWIPLQRRMNSTPELVPSSFLLLVRHLLLLAWHHLHDPLRPKSFCKVQKRCNGVCLTSRICTRTRQPVVKP